MKKLIKFLKLWLKGSFCQQCKEVKELPRKSNMIIYQWDGCRFEYWCKDCEQKLIEKDNAIKEKSRRLSEAIYLDRMNNPRI